MYLLNPSPPGQVPVLRAVARGEQGVEVGGHLREVGGVELGQEDGGHQEEVVPQRFRQVQVDEGQVGEEQDPDQGRQHPEEEPLQGQLAMNKSHSLTDGEHIKSKSNVKVF